MIILLSAKTTLFFLQSLPAPNKVWSTSELINRIASEFFSKDIHFQKTKYFFHIVYGDYKLLKKWSTLKPEKTESDVHEISVK